MQIKKCNIRVLNTLGIWIQREKGERDREPKKEREELFIKCSNNP